MSVILSNQAWNHVADPEIFKPIHQIFSTMWISNTDPENVTDAPPFKKSLRWSPVLYPINPVNFMEIHLSIFCNIAYRHADAPSFFSVRV